MVTPTPFRTVRRDRCFCVMIHSRLLGTSRWKLADRLVQRRRAFGPPARSARAILNAGLLTTPSTNADILLSFFAASRTIARIIGMSVYSTRRPSA